MVEYHGRSDCAQRRFQKTRRGCKERRLFGHPAAGDGWIEPGAGSSGKTFGQIPGFPKLHVLDSTDPAQVKAFENKVDLAKTLFVVSSKSGSTLEPNIFKQYFFEQVKKAVGPDKAGSRFIAVTDPGSKLWKSPRRMASVRSSPAWRISAGVTRCCRISVWCRQQQWGSTPAVPQPNAADG